MENLKLSNTFTLKELYEWVAETKPTQIDLSQVQWDHYLSLLQPQEKVLKFRGIDVRINEGHIHS